MNNLRWREDSTNTYAYDDNGLIFATIVEKESTNTIDYAIFFTDIAGYLQFNTLKKARVFVEGVYNLLLKEHSTEGF